MQELTQSEEESIEDTETAESNTNEKRSLIEMLPILSLCLIFVGFLKLKIYYSLFDINILEYLDLTEIVLLFLNDISFIVLFVIVILFYSLGMIKFLGERNNEHLNFSTDSNPEWIENGIRNYFQNRKRWRKITITVFLISSILFYFFSNLLLLCLTACYVFQSLFVIIENLMSQDEEEFGAPKFAVTSSAIITILLFTIGLAYCDRDAILFDNDKHITIVTNEGKFFESNNDYKYLGKTSKYTYLYCNSERKAEILKNEDVKKIEVKKIKNNFWDELKTKLKFKLFSE